jgi:hypothetical protein
MQTIFGATQIVLGLNELVTAGMGFFKEIKFWKNGRNVNPKHETTGYKMRLCY